MKSLLVQCLFPHCTLMVIESEQESRLHVVLYNFSEFVEEAFFVIIEIF